MSRSHEGIKIRRQRVQKALIRQSDSITKGERLTQQGRNHMSEQERI